MIAREPGAENPSIPTWANDSNNPTQLSLSPQPVDTVRVEKVPGAFQILNVLSDEECDNLIKISESIGYTADAAVSLPRTIRHNFNVTWVVDDATSAILWNRCESLISLKDPSLRNLSPVGLNARFRFYRYKVGDYFGPHTDGAWSESKIVNRRLVSNTFTDRYSQLSFIVFLSDGYSGGRTEFFLGSDHDKKIKVTTPKGGVLCFPHGAHPLHCVHGSETITDGTKYIVRTDVLFTNKTVQSDSKIVDFNKTVT